jgi:hypothetical protein
MPISCQFRGSFGDDAGGRDPAAFPLAPLAGGAGGCDQTHPMAEAWLKQSAYRYHL